MSPASKSSHRYEKLARIYDDEILPIWSRPFGRMLLRGLKVPDKGQVLDVACGTGYPAVEIVRKMGDGCRLIAIDASSAMLNVARKKIAETGRKGVFFRTESAQPRLSFADGVYDLVVCNLGITDSANPALTLADFARVTRPGGEVRCTLPIDGTFQEFYDIYREVLVKHDKHEVLARLTEHLKTYPTPEELTGWLDAAGLADGRVEVEEFSLLFRSSREFFFAPVIEYGPLTAWKKIAGKGQQLQDVFWHIKEAIDAYFGERAFQVTVKAGCLIGTVPTDLDEETTGKVAPLDDDEIELVTGEIALADDLSEDEDAAAVEDVPLEAFVDDGAPPEYVGGMDTVPDDDDDEETNRDGADGDH